MKMSKSNICGDIPDCYCVKLEHWGDIAVFFLFVYWFNFVFVSSSFIVLEVRLRLVMASRQGSKSRKSGSSNLKGADSTASSTTSSSKLYQETDGHSSPASSSAQSKQQFFSPDSLPRTAQRAKENVTVTVRFRPLRLPVICLYRLANIRLIFVLLVWHVLSLT